MQLLIVAALAVMAGGAYLAFDHSRGDIASSADPRKGRARRPQRVDITKPQPREMETSVEAVGTSLARQSIEVVPLTEGRVEAIRFRAGQKVARTDVLVELDDDIERADVAQAEAVLKEAQLAYNRAQTLMSSQAGRRSSLDEAAAKYATARASLDRAQRKLRDRVVRAPFSGVVGIRQVHVGARVDEKTVLTTLDDLSSIDIAFQVPERHYAKLAPGHIVVATTAAFPDRTFLGKISAIDSRIDQIGRAFKVRATLPNPDDALPAGLFMLVRIVFEKSQPLTVPEEAIISEGDNTFVFVVNQGRAKRVQVQLGRRIPGFVEVKQGLAAEQAVVVKGHARLRDGGRVSVTGSKDRPGAGRRKGGDGESGRTRPAPATKERRGEQAGQRGKGDKQGRWTSKDKDKRSARATQPAQPGAVGQ